VHNLRTPPPPPAKFEFAASGDGGVVGQFADPSCAAPFAPYPSTSAWVTAVGATAPSRLFAPIQRAALKDSGFDSFADETLGDVVSMSQDINIITSGGGSSSIFSTPAYQAAALQSVKTANDSLRFNASRRVFPDLSLSGVSFPLVMNGKVSFYVVEAQSHPPPPLPQARLGFWHLRLNAPLRRHRREFERPARPRFASAPRPPQPLPLRHRRRKPGGIS
jgi:hypothetical protein